jgi:hypothetical protein
MTYQEYADLSMLRLGSVIVMKRIEWSFQWNLTCVIGRKDEYLL